jgi:hypothetical protein
LHWQGALGENTSPLEIEVDRFYGVLAESGLYGSIQHHELSINATSNYRYEVTSSSFASQIYLFNRERSRFFRSWNLNADSNLSPDIFENPLVKNMDFDLSVGSFPLNSSDAVPDEFLNPGAGSPVGDGLYEIRGYRIFGETVSAPAEEPS